LWGGAEQVLAFESSAEEGQNGIRLVDRISLEKKKGKTTLVDFGTAKLLLDARGKGQLLLLEVLWVDLNEGDLEIAKQVSDWLQLASKFEIDENKRDGFVHY